MDTVNAQNKNKKNLKITDEVSEEEHKPIFKKKNEKSKIVTFYSYKGGVGRSMAMANVAHLLAEKYRYKVIIVDWDLEAPGLHKFFDIDDEKIINGLIDIFYDYKNLMKQKISSMGEDFINIDKYILKILDSSHNGGSISIIPAGRQNLNYASKVNNFDWDEFYENWHGFGFIEYLKEQLKKRADIIMVDSRTGVTDIGGICTLQMPDVVVLLFSLNEQGISGTEMIIESILRKSIKVSEEKVPPKLIIVPSRVEKYLEKKIKDKWELKSAERFAEYLPEKGKENALIYMKKKSIPYVGYYSFGEMLAVKDDPYGELSESLENLAKMILEASNFREKEFSQTSVSEEEDTSLIVLGLFVVIFVITGFLEFIKFISNILFKEKLNAIVYVDKIIMYLAYLIILIGIIYILYKIYILFKTSKWKYWIKFRKP